MFFFFEILITAIALCILLNIILGAPYVPTHKNVVQKIVTYSQITPKTKFVDLGSGDGRVLIAAALAGAEAHGYEINPLLVWFSRYQIRKNNLQGKAFAHFGNFWSLDFSQFNVVSIFGRPGIMANLEKKLFSELRPNSIIISNVFPLPKSAPTKHDDPLYIYKL